MNLKIRMHWNTAFVAYLGQLFQLTCFLLRHVGVGLLIQSTETVTNVEDLAQTVGYLQDTALAELQYRRDILLTFTVFIIHVN